MSYFIGLMSGTSMDAVDAALVEISGDNFKTIATLSLPYPQAVRQQLIDAIQPERKLSLHEFGILDAMVAKSFAATCDQLLEESGFSPKQIAAIGSHGQTLRHSPDSEPPYTIQIGNGAIIAAHTKIDTVSDFRSCDVAGGGQGAPLVPAFHEYIFRDDVEDRAILNIGGISNLTMLPSDHEEPIVAFDTGPGNCLLDDWVYRHQKLEFDAEGKWGSSGTVDQSLLKKLLRDSYFRRNAPKSTGREYFNLDWLRKTASEVDTLVPVDVQATLLALTTESIVQHVLKYMPTCKSVLVCGGGSLNCALLQQLDAGASFTVQSCTDYAIDPMMVEAAAFAWFAHNRLNEIPILMATRPRTTSVIVGALNLAF